MFTGLIEAVGTVTAINKQRGTVTIKCGITGGIEIGNSGTRQNYKVWQN